MAPVESNEPTTIKKNNLPETIKVYKKRWLILFIFLTYSIATLVQIVLYVAIADVVRTYYNVSYTNAEWVTMIYTVVNLIFNIPGSYILEKIGLRWCAIIGISGTCVGAWIKVGSVHPSRFYVLLLGQGVGALFQCLSASYLTKLAAVWFGPNEVSTACGIASMSYQMSFLIGFVMAPLIVDGSDITEIEYGLTRLAYVIAIFCTILLPIIILFFSDAPPTPPSVSQINKQGPNGVEKNFYTTLKSIFSNRSFMTLVLIIGIGWGVDYVITVTMLNQLLLKYHPDANKDVGYLAGINAIWGMIGAYVFGLCLDKFKCYKEITIVVVILHNLAIICLIYTLSFNIYYIYVMMSFSGVISFGGSVVVYILGVELTYPEPESIVTVLLITSYQVFSIAFTYIYTYLIEATTDFWANIITAVILIISSALVFSMKFDLRRQEAEKQTQI